MCSSCFYLFIYLIFHRTGHGLQLGANSQWCSNLTSKCVVLALPLIHHVTFGRVASVSPYIKWGWTRSVILNPSGVLWASEDLKETVNTVQKNSSWRSDPFSAPWSLPASFPGLMGSPSVHPALARRGGLWVGGHWTASRCLSSLHFVFFLLPFLYFLILKAS